MGNKIYRQGDVLIQEINKAETEKHGETIPREDGRLILAYGEVTGHIHAIADDGATLSRMDDAMLLSVTKGGGASLKHEEHGTIHLPKGNYRVTIQREYTPESIRNVED